MKAAVLFEPNAPPQIENVSVRTPKSQEVLARTSFAGICYADQHCMEVQTPYPMPVFLGHESSCIEESVGGEIRCAGPCDQVVIRFPFESSPDFGLAGTYHDQTLP